MPRDINYDSSDSESTHRQNRGLSKKFYRFYREPNECNIKQGSPLHKRIQEEKSAIDAIIREVKQQVAKFNGFLDGFLDVFQSKYTYEKLKGSKNHRFAMLDKAVHPDELAKRFSIARQSLLEAESFSNENTTMEDIKVYLLEWKRDCQLLVNLVHQMNKSLEQVRKEVEEALPRLEKEAQRTLDQLEHIPNWQDRVAKLEPQTQDKFNLSRDL